MNELQTCGARILAVDDSSDALELIRRLLVSDGHTVYTADGVEQAVRFLSTTPVDLVITDMKMPGHSGFELIGYIRDNFHHLRVIMVTGYPSIESAVEAVKGGADEYLTKPFTRKELLAVVEQVLARQRQTLATRETETDPAPAMGGIVGQSPVMVEVSQAVAKAARVNATVLIQGESGTGKELVARAIHYQSARARHPFVPINCGGIPENLLESELFGHVKGAFTGATTSRAGFFQTADRGTLFLDEVSETSLAMQVKLLRVLQEREVCMVGADRPQSVDVRIIAGSNKDLSGLITAGRFRNDLFYRLNVINITLPPLRARGDDILLLVRHFAAKYAREMGREPPRFTDHALSHLLSYPWPGNVRELENLVQRLLAMVEGPRIDTPDLPAAMRGPDLYLGSALDRTLAQVEADHIRHVLESAGGNRSQAARILDIDRKTLRDKLKRYGLDAE